jgi:ribosomal protein L11 methyltransferase
VEYLEISIAVPSTAVEATADLLRRYAPAGVSIEPQSEAIDEDGGVRIDAMAPVRVRAWLVSTPENETIAGEMRATFGGLLGVPIEFSATDVDDAGWRDNWKDYFHTLRLGRRLVIKPSWREHAALPDDIVIELDPGMAFGTGQHATTQLCLEALEEQVRGGMQVLDVGCGSGILGIAAAKLGASSVEAVDVDPLAVSATRENASRNGAQLSVRQGSLDRASRQSYDLVVANLSARLVAELAGQLVARISVDGTLLASGMIEEQESACRKALEQAGAVAREVRRRDGWLLIVAGRC